MGASALPPVRVTHIHNPWIDIEAFYAVTRSRQLTASGNDLFTGLLPMFVAHPKSPPPIRIRSRANRVPSVSVVHCGFDVGKFNARASPIGGQSCASFAGPRNPKSSCSPADSTVQWNSIILKTIRIRGSR